jgi:8-oxo-dGTP pyrophosphatase MutT (NUDIX family)
MSGWGTAAVVVSDRGVLLTRRADFEVWCLPGGGVEDGEFVADEAIREVREETGLDVKLTGLVGIYYRPRTLSVRDGHVVVFLAQGIGGEARPQTDEVLDVGVFDADELPAPLMWWNRQVIRDAITGVGGSALWHQEPAWPFGPEVGDRRALYELRDRSGLGPADFYRRYLDRTGPSG